MPSRAILLKTRPPGSPGLGSREELPIVTRPRATSEMPTSEPPWSSLNWTQCLHWVTYARASLAASGATEVEPLIVIVGFAAADAGTATATAIAAGSAAVLRECFKEDSFRRRGS